MAGFPSTGLLDNFNRSDGPLGAAWEELTTLGAGMPDVLNSAAVGGDGYKGARLVASFPADQESYFTLRAAASAGVFFGLWVRLTDDNGYQISYDPLTGKIALSRVDAGTVTILDDEDYSPGDGHGIGITAQGSTIRGWVRVGPTWTKVFEEDDATYETGSLAFHIFELGDPDLILDDFGGGALGGEGQPPVNTAIPALLGIAETGRTMTCDPGEWTGDTPISYSYQWQRSSVDINGEETDSYEFVEADQGADVRCRVYALNAAGVGVEYSRPTQPTISTEGLDDTLVAVDGAWVPVKMKVAVDGEWF